MEKAKKKAMAKPTKAGTSKQAAAQRKRFFAYAYVANGRNGTQAAITAGCPTRGAAVAAARMLKDTKVLKIIAEIAEKALEKAQFTSEEAILSMARAVRFDPRKLYTPVFDADGNPMKDGRGRQMMRMLETWELDDDTALAIQSIEYDEIKTGGEAIGRTVKLKVCDRNTARDQAHKYFGHYEKDNEQASKVVKMAGPDYQKMRAELAAKHGTPSRSPRA
jgi:hypothetical protein